MMILNVSSQLLASGSFGHFQASKSGVHKGGLHKLLVRAGFVATRISVRMFLLYFFFPFSPYFSESVPNDFVPCYEAKFTVFYLQVKNI